jgi:hypothetical protein
MLKNTVCGMEEVSMDGAASSLPHPVRKTNAAITITIYIVPGKKIFSFIVRPFHQQTPKLNL